MELTFSYEGKTPYRPTPMVAWTKKRVCEWRDKIIDEKVEPWWVVGTGKPLRVTMRSGKTISAQGVKFEGTIRDVFWDRTFIPPFLEDAIEGVLQEVAGLCREHSLPPDDYLTEAAAYLKGMVCDVYHEMARIDGRLTHHAHGYQRPDLFESYIKPMEQRVDDHKKAASLLAGQQEKSTRPGQPSGLWKRLSGWLWRLYETTIKAAFEAILKQMNRP
jgi:hypothetical protein